MDHLSCRVAFRALLALPLLLSGCGMPSFLIKPVNNVQSLEEIEATPGRGGKIAIIEVEGMLMNGRAGGLLGPDENPLSLFTQQLEQARTDADVKAVVLRINSPGGTVTCSDTMYEMVRQFRQTTKKPVIADAQEVAASGAYYVACGADQIVAAPTSVIGSIGVIFESFNVAGAMNKLGVVSDPVKSGPLKDMGSPFKPLDPAAKQVMQGMVDEYYARFVEVVRTNRHLDKADSETIRTITDGRVFSGTQARQLGLIDATGLLPDAIDLARKAAGAPNASVILYKRPFGYSGSIYARTATPQPQAANSIALRLPEAMELPRGFYYLWQ